MKALVSMCLLIITTTNIIDYIYVILFFCYAAPFLYMTFSSIDVFCPSPALKQLPNQVNNNSFSIKQAPLVKDEPIISTAISTLSVPAPSKHLCPSCGAKRKKQDAFCSKCGAELPAISSSIPGGSEKKILHLQIALVLVSGAAVIITAVIGTLLYNKAIYATKAENTIQTLESKLAYSYNDIDAEYRLNINSRRGFDDPNGSISQFGDYNSWRKEEN